MPRDGFCPLKGRQLARLPTRSLHRSPAFPIATGAASIRDLGGRVNLNHFFHPRCSYPALLPSGGCSSEDGDAG